MSSCRLRFRWAQVHINAARPACMGSQHWWYSWHGGPVSAWLPAWGLYAAGKGSAWQGPEQHSIACVPEPASMQSVAGMTAPILGQQVFTTGCSPEVDCASFLICTQGCACQPLSTGWVCGVPSHITYTPVLCCLQAFAPAFWAGEVLYDKDKAVFQALGNGKIRCSISRQPSIL